MLKALATVIIGAVTFRISLVLRKKLIDHLEYRRFVYGLLKSAKDNLYSSFRDINDIIDEEAQKHNISREKISTDTELTEYIRKYRMSDIKELRLETEKALSLSERLYLDAKNEFEGKALVCGACPIIIFVLVCVILV